MKIVLTIEGSISGLKGWDEFAEKLTSLVDAGYSEIVVDFRNVGQISSLALGTILASHSKMLAAGRKLVVTNLNDEIKRIAAETKILDKLNIE
jgi:anti-anti-sigma factor